jgi:2-C-methyl-D-erythritol 4-phosphate cytidylyltransferase
MVSVIIVAAGRGVRMQATLRKQYVSISGISILGHTLLAVDACDMIDNITLVIPKGDVEYCQKNIISSLKLHSRVHLVEGGDQRCDSVYNGLMALDKKTQIVVIHDGVRPFIHSKQIKECIVEAKKTGACILGVPVSDTLKYVKKTGSIIKTLDRKSAQLAQTPQVFKYDLILKAHACAKKDGFNSSDDAQLVERIGKKVKIISGSRWNIKITEKEDLMFAETLLKNSTQKRLRD